MRKLLDECFRSSQWYGVQVLLSGVALSLAPTRASVQESIQVPFSVYFALMQSAPLGLIFANVFATGAPIKPHSEGFGVGVAKHRNNDTAIGILHVDFLNALRPSGLVGTGAYMGDSGGNVNVYIAFNESIFSGLDANAYLSSKTVGTWLRCTPPGWLIPLQAYFSIGRFWDHPIRYTIGGQYLIGGRVNLGCGWKCNERVFECHITLCANAKLFWGHGAADTLAMQRVLRLRRNSNEVLDNTKGHGQDLPTWGGGLENPGNLCFRNAVLQALTYCPALQTEVMHHRRECSRCDPGLPCGLCAFGEHICTQKKRLVAPLNHIPPCQKFLDIIEQYVLAPHDMDDGEQHCAFEFLGSLLQFFHWWDKSSPILRSWKDLPRLDVTSGIGRLICMSIQDTSTRRLSTEVGLSLHLALAKPRSVSDALSNYFYEPAHDGQSHSDSSRVKRWQIIRSPELLVVHLHRVDYNAIKQTPYKVLEPIDIPETLDLSPYLDTKPSQPMRYRLCSVVDHRGHSANFGHYTAKCQGPGGKWYCFNDENVVPLIDQTFPIKNSRTACLLFFIRDHQEA